jgi:hypothetical protein
MTEDLSEQLRNMLADPAAMSRVMEIAGSLMGQNAPAQESAPDADAAASPPPLPNGLPAAMLPQLLGMLSGAAADDPRAALLIALKPYLSDARRERADALIRALGLASAAQKFLSEGGN